MRSNQSQLRASWRTMAHRLREGSRNAILRMRLRRALAELEAKFLDGRPPTSALIERLVHAWGNESWSATAPFLMGMLGWLPRTSGAIVECGSGLSTLVLAAALIRGDRTLLSLEHDRSWAERIGTRLPARTRSFVTVALSPLDSYGSFDWYSLPPAQLPTSIGFVVCDGPPGSTRGGRYGMGPVLKDRLAPGCIVLLDDTHRSEERAILQRWRTELGGEVVEDAPTYSVLRVGGA
jgi:hypothetical protein